MVFYHAGARYLMNEIPIYLEEEKKLSGWGPAWFDVCRYARLHPCRGEPRVRIAVMRALGDEWNRAAAPSSGWESGLWLPRTEIGRGVGPTDREISCLEQYVKEGGTLFVAGGQLRGEDDGFAVGRFCGVSIEGAAELDGLPYVRLRAGEGRAEIVRSLPNGDPDVIRAQVGKGVAYVSSGEWLTYWGREAPETLLRAELENAGWLDLDPVSGWIEYAVGRKGRTWVFALFNHGRGFFPSGNGRDHGPWEGTIGIDLDDLGLLGENVTVLRAKYTPDVAKPFALVPVPHAVKDGRLEVQVRVEDTAELIVGPAAEAETDFFR